MAQPIGHYIVATGGTLTIAAGVVHMYIDAAQLNGGTWTTDAASRTSY